MTHIVPRKRRASIELEACQIKRRSSSSKSHGAVIIQQWLIGHPEDESEYEFSAQYEDLSTQRPAASSSFKKRGKYAPYDHPNYISELALRGGFAQSSAAGLVQVDQDMCDQLVLPPRITREERALLASMPEPHSRGSGLRSLNIFMEVQALISLSSVEYSCRGDLFIDCINLKWDQAVPFYGPAPRPDHTYGFRPTVLTEVQQRKLHSNLSATSYYAPRNNILFPFLTSFVKCGTAACDIADRAAVHAMTVASRGIVDLYQRAGRASELHRRALGFSIFSDDRHAALCVHYPEIGIHGTATYYRDIFFTMRFRDNLDRWACGQYTLNICEQFAPTLLQQLMFVIDELPDPDALAAEDNGGRNAWASNSDESTLQADGDNSTLLDDEEESTLVDEGTLVSVASA
ncbi:hypothetical protein AYL99_09812 [Fonsecaea erecta]|uniref:DUF7924 domain-containing protein n=1 Tax=Fonsecaea erecta TaxID=1367422 RepID=A0A178Z7A4_9EURO|nr:hypothetical protein AYL99_09812 [Fonsecaea erecta]OAP55660.1 hypothetical protein AYL99_09812 [Fonsecaea erecta]